eukprot:TRINITY_DN49528_c0_g1_i1.p1 TRINITY_DN49528_c0_g1~~TRINITY_DN49528_c0_g1_i1.p1  ORF type:complete len:229 (+),score=53.32 TRINITY_DN49528_c0_g1_i1:89-775(+)
MTLSPAPARRFSRSLVSDATIGKNLQRELHDLDGSSATANSRLPAAWPTLHRSSKENVLLWVCDDGLATFGRQPLQRRRASSQTKPCERLDTNVEKLSMRLKKTLHNMEQGVHVAQFCEVSGWAQEDGMTELEPEVGTMFLPQFGTGAEDMQEPQEANALGAASAAASSPTSCPLSLLGQHLLRRERQLSTAEEVQNSTKQSILHWLGSARGWLEVQSCHSRSPAVWL